jgi:uroporphyrinogen decarboxylase
MSSHDLVNDLLRGRRVGHVPVEDLAWDDTVLAWTRQGYPMRVVHRERGESTWRPSDGRWVAAAKRGEYREPVPPWEHFGWDMDLIWLSFDKLPVAGQSDLLEETEEWEVRRNGAGAALKYWKHKNGTPEHVDFRMTSREIWEREYRPLLERFEPGRLDVEKTRRELDAGRARGAWTFYGDLFVWELARGSLGDLCLYETLLLDPGWIRDFNRIYTDFYKRSFAWLFEHAGIPSGIWLYEDLGYRNGLFARPEIFADLYFPCYAEMVEFYHGYGLPVVLHSCGSVPKALPMIVEAGFDGLNPMERKAEGNDPFRFAELYGERIAFVGGLDARILETNDRDLIRREVADYLDGMKAREARLVFGSDHSLSPLIRYDTYRYALEVYRENMAY